MHPGASRLKISQFRSATPANSALPCHASPENARRCSQNFASVVALLGKRTQKLSEDEFLLKLMWNGCVRNRYKTVLPDFLRALSSTYGLRIARSGNAYHAATAQPSQQAYLTAWASGGDSSPLRRLLTLLVATHKTWIANGPGSAAPDCKFSVCLQRIDRVGCRTTEANPAVLMKQPPVIPRVRAGNILRTC